MRLLVFAAFTLAAAPVHAQPADVLCGSLDRIIASAADAPMPFVSMGADYSDTLAVGSVSDMPPGLQGAEQCDARMPASAQRYGAAAGEYWEFACTLYSAGDRENSDARAESETYRDNMVQRARACLAPKGWSNAPGASPAEELHLAKAGSIVTVHVTHEVTGNERRGRYFTSALSIRLNGGPKPPSAPPPPLRGRD